MRGHVVDVTQKLTEDARNIIAQWIGGSNVIRNQKIRENEAAFHQWKELGEKKEDRPVFDQKAAHIKSIEGFDFLKTIPSPITGAAATLWYQDMNAMLKGLRKKPKIRGRDKKRSCYLTKALYDVHRLDDDHCVVRIRRSNKKCHQHDYILHVRMPFNQRDAANSLRISRQGDRFWLSMGYQVEFDVPDEQTIRESFAGLTEEAAKERVSGFDIGIVRQTTDENGVVYHLTDVEKAALTTLEKRKARYQKKYSQMARANDKRAGSNKRSRTKNEKAILEKIAQMDANRARIRKYISHRLSKQIAVSSNTIATFEDMNLQNLTKKPKAKFCEETGKWLRNGAKAKAGLNKAWLNLNVGQIRDYAKYKLTERGKLMIKVNPAYTSQDCSECRRESEEGKKNRRDQATFICTRCTYTANADENAARNIRNKGLKQVVLPSFSKGKKAVKKITVRRT